MAGLHDRRLLPHPKVVVATPHSDIMDLVYRKGIVVIMDGIHSRVESRRCGLSSE